MLELDLMIEEPRQLDVICQIAVYRHIAYGVSNNYSKVEISVDGRDVYAMFWTYEKRGIYIAGIWSQDTGTYSYHS